jgi:hypothetical protein
MHPSRRGLASCIGENAQQENTVSTGPELRTASKECSPLSVAVSHANTRYRSSAARAETFAKPYCRLAQ